MIKVSVPQENIVTLNVYASNNRASKHVTQKLKEKQGKNKHPIVLNYIPL